MALYNRVIKQIQKERGRVERFKPVSAYHRTHLSHCSIQPRMRVSRNSSSMWEKVASSFGSSATGGSLRSLGRTTSLTIVRHSPFQAFKQSFRQKCKLGSQIGTQEGRQGKSLIQMSAFFPKPAYHIFPTYISYSLAKGWSAQRNLSSWNHKISASCELACFQECKLFLNKQAKCFREFFNAFSIGRKILQFNMLFSPAVPLSSTGQAVVFLGS